MRGWSIIYWLSWWALVASAAVAQPGDRAFVVKDFSPGIDPNARKASHGPPYAFVHQGKCYFPGASYPTYPDGGINVPSVLPGRLVVNDGTWDGTIGLLTADNIKFLGTLGNLVVFSSSEFGTTQGRTVSVTDSTLGGTRPLATIDDAMDVNLGVAANGVFYFRVELASATRALWRTDGTVIGTKPENALLPQGWAYDLEVAPQAMDDGRLVTAVVDGTGRRNLCLSNGTAPGTRLVFNSSWYQDFGGPDDIAVGGNTIYFRSGRDWFSTNGTQTLTDYLAELTVDDGASGETRLYASKTHGYALTNFKTGSADLWGSDGTHDGSSFIRSIPYSWSSTQIVSEKCSDDRLFFIERGSAPRASDGMVVPYEKLWASDASTAGTLAIWQQEGGFTGTLVTPGGAYFTNNRIETGLVGLYHTDGTPSGTARMTTNGDFVLHGATPNASAPFGERLFMTGKPYNDTTFGRELWITDGSDSTTKLARDLSSAGQVVTVFNPTVTIGDSTFFHDGNRKHLWVTHGSDEGTFPIGSTDKTVGLDFRMEMVGSDLEMMTVRGRDKLMILSRGIICEQECCKEEAEDETITILDLIKELAGSADDECCPWTYVTSVWESDGTLQGTRWLGYIRDEWLHDPTPFSGRVMAWSEELAKPCSKPPEIWPMSLFSMISASPAGSDIYEFQSGTKRFKPLGEANGRFFFSTLEPCDHDHIDPTRDYQLWSTNGGIGGTELIRPILTPDGMSETIFRIGTTFKDEFYFVPTINDELGNPLVEGELWVTNGHRSGTRRFMKIETDLGDEPIRNLAATSDRLFFTGRDNELWTSNGTTVYTVPMTYVTGRPDFRVDQFLGVVNDRLIMTRTLETTGTELWSTDGTAAQTYHLPEARNGPETSPFLAFAPIEGFPFALYTSGSAKTGLEMYYTNGIPSGTFPLFEMSPGPYSSNPSGYTRNLGGILFEATTPDEGTRLWMLSISRIEAPKSDYWGIPGFVVPD